MNNKMKSLNIMAVIFLSFLSCIASSEEEFDFQMFEESYQRFFEYIGEPQVRPNIKQDEIGVRRSHRDGEQRDVWFVHVRGVGFELDMEYHIIEYVVGLREKTDPEEVFLRNAYKLSENDKPKLIEMAEAFLRACGEDRNNFGEWKIEDIGSGWLRAICVSANRSYRGLPVFDQESMVLFYPENLQIMRAGFSMFGKMPDDVSVFFSEAESFKKAFIYLGEWFFSFKDVAPDIISFNRQNKIQDVYYSTFSLDVVSTPVITLGIYHPNYEFNPEKQKLLKEKLPVTKFLDDLNDLSDPHVAYEIRFEMDVTRGGYVKNPDTSSIEKSEGKLRYQFKVYVDGKTGEFLGGRHDWYDPWH